MTETPSQATIEANEAAKLSGNNNFDVLSSLPIDGPKSKVPVELSIETESKGDSNGKEVKDHQEGQEKADKADVLEGSNSSPSKVPTTEEKRETSTPSVLSKAKFQDKEIEVPDDATFTFKASKGEITVPLADLKQSYQSKAERDKLYGQFQKERSSWEANKATVESRFSDFAKGLKENPWEVMSKLSSLYKTNPAEVLPVYLAQAKKTLDELEKLPEEQQKVVFAKMGLDWQAKEIENNKKEIDIKKADEADTKYGDELATKHQITQDELDKAWNVLSSTESLHLDKKTKRETIDLLVSYVTQFDRPYTKIEGALNKVDASLNQNVNLKKEIHALITDLDTEEDVVNLIKLYLGKDGANGSSSGESAKVEVPKEVERKAESKPKSEKTPPKKEKPRQTIDDEDDILDLDDLVRSYQGR